MSIRSVRSAAAIATIVLLVIPTAAAAIAERSKPRAPTRVAKTIKAIGTHWSPATVHIARDGTVRWKAVSNAPHTVTAYGGNWRFARPLSTGDVERHAFRRTGIYRFRCRIHSSLVNGRCSGMCGKVVVRS